MDTPAWIFVGFMAAVCLVGLPFFLVWAIEIAEDFKRAWLREWVQVRASFRRLRGLVAGAVSREVEILPGNAVPPGWPYRGDEDGRRWATPPLHPRTHSGFHLTMGAALTQRGARKQAERALAEVAERPGPTSTRRSR